MVEVKDPTARVNTNAAVAVVSDNIQIDTNIVHKHNIELNANNYVLTTEGALGLATGGTPQWLSGALDTILAGDFTEIEELISNLKIIVGSLEDGVNQQISSLNDGLQAQNIKIDSNVSRIEDSESAILNVENTYATEDFAVATSTDVLAAAVTDGTISTEAVIIGLSETVATDTIASSQIINGVYSIINDANTGNVALAGATEVLYSNVGIDENGNILAEAGHLRDFKVEIEGVDVRLLSEEGISAGTPHEITLEEWNALRLESIEQILVTGTDTIVTPADAIDSVYNVTTDTILFVDVDYTDNLDGSVTMIGGTIGDTISVFYYESAYSNKIGRYKESALSSGDPEDGSGIYWEYVGLPFGQNSDGWNLMPSTPTNQVSWTGGASKLLYGPDNDVTGWAFSDGTAYGLSGSVFEIYADNFAIKHKAGAGSVPFSIDAAGDIAITEDVSIGGNLLVSGTSWIGGNVESVGYSWNAGNPTGFTLSGDGEPDSGESYNFVGGKIFGATIDGVNINGSNIIGSSIYGAHIEGSIIKSSWTDHSSSKDLTNWIEYTLSVFTIAYPSYVVNLAEDSTTGQPLEDLAGNVRLQGMKNVYTPQISQTIVNSAAVYTPNINVFKYDSFNQSSPNRIFSPDPNLIVDRQTTLLFLVLQGSYSNDAGGTLTFDLAGIPVILELYSFYNVPDTYTRIKLTINGIVQIDRASSVAHYSYNNSYNVGPISLKFQMSTVGSTLGLNNASFMLNIGQYVLTNWNGNILHNVNFTRYSFESESYYSVSILPLEITS